jgi:Domain of unknown function (DUF4440)
MKRCPTCNRTFTDRNLSFCTEDGTPLITLPSDEATVDSPGIANGGAIPGKDTGAGNQSTGWTPPAYQPPGSALSGKESKRKNWPWVVGILAILLIVVAGVGIAAIVIPKMLRASVNKNRPGNANVGPRDNYNSNLNSNTSGANENLATSNANHASNENSWPNVGADTPAPTDEAQVLAALTDLEHEWTVANINADKRKLDHILADDYVGSSNDGKSQGKAEYLDTIERDKSIQKWDFDDLKVRLNGERATLTGLIKLQIENRDVSFRFVDKFVWRDGRWQATSSEVSRIK